MNRSALSAVFSAALLIFTASLCAADTVYVIQKGDTLYSLAKKYGVSVDEICAYNGISNAAKIKLGQSIRIPEKGAAAAGGSSGDLYTEYVVISGDTLFGIARAFDTSVASIRAANGLSENATLKTGQHLRIPVPKPSTAEQLAQIAPAESPISDPRSYQTKSVDSKTVWPVKATELNYVAGKTNSVLLEGSKGERVTAVKGGKVIFSGLYRGFGQVVFVQPKASDYVYVYSGLETIAVRKGDTVDYGATIGTLGVDTLTQKPQLNFMVFKNGSAVDPATAPRG